VVIRRIHHVGIVVKRLGDAFDFYRDALGLRLVKEAVVPDQGVRAALLAAGDSEIELLEPLDPNSGVGRFLARRGEGLHHVCFETPDVGRALEALRARDEVELLDAAPRAGLAGQIAFLHPRTCLGVLVELATPEPPAAEPGGDAAARVQLKRLVVGARDVRQTADRFRSLFGLQEIAMNTGPRMMLSAGRTALLIVPASEVGDAEGMIALSLLAVDFQALNASLTRAGAKCLKGAGEVTVEPASSHGVHLHISKYE